MAVAETASAPQQPSGAALPSLIPPIVTGVRDHAAYARNLDLTSILLEKAMTPQIRNLTTRVTSNPLRTLAKRAKATQTLQDLPDKLAPLREKWKALSPETSPARKLNLPLIHKLVLASKFPDSRIAYDLFYGMPIVGDVEPVETLRERETPPSLTLDQLAEGLRGNNAAVIARITRDQNSDLSAVCWGETLKEAEKGWISQPVPVTEAAMASTPLTPRFAIREKHGNQAAKVRLIDDFKASRLNETLGLHGTHTPRRTRHCFSDGARLPSFDHPARGNGSSTQGLRG